MLTKLARTYFNDAVVDIQRRKALAFAIYLKNKNTTSVFKDWTIRSIARDAGVATGTAKKRLDLLRQMHLVRIENHAGHSYLFFKKLRRSKIRNKNNSRYHTPVNLDIVIDIKESWSVRDIEKYLMALDIQEHTRKVEYTKRLIKLAKDPAKFTRNREVKRAKAIFRKRGITDIPDFKEYGYSYRRIAKRLHCGTNTTSFIIALGESMGLFQAHKSELVLVKYIGNREAKFALPYFKDEFQAAFATTNSIYYRPVTTFSLLEKVCI